MATRTSLDGARGAARWIRRGPCVAAGATAGVIYLLLPLVTGLDYRMLAQRGAYQLMWSNLLGAHYKLPIETPKPLSVLFAGLFGSGTAYYALTCAMVGLCVAALVRLGKTITGSLIPGLIAAVIAFAFRGGFAYLAFTGGTEPFHLAFVLLALVALADGRSRLAALVILAACLQRPEAWSLAPLPLLMAFVAGRRSDRLLLLPFLAPFIWLACDWAMTGDWLYSLHVTSYYRIASGVAIAPGTGSFGVDMLVELADLVGVSTVVVGLAGLAVWQWRQDRLPDANEATYRHSKSFPIALGFALVAPFFASLLASAGGRVLQMQRFQYPSATLLALLAASSPYLLSGGRSPRWPALVVSAAIGLSVFAPKQVAQSIRRARAEQVLPTAFDAAAGTIRRLVETEGAEVVIVSSRRSDYFAKLLGQAN
jgi:hypothetical protein